MLHFLFHHTHSSMLLYLCLLLPLLCSFFQNTPSPFNCPFLCYLSGSLSLLPQFYTFSFSFATFPVTSVVAALFDSSCFLPLITRLQLLASTMSAFVCFSPNTSPSHPHILKMFLFSDQLSPAFPKLFKIFKICGYTFFLFLESLDQQWKRYNY